MVDDFRYKFAHKNLLSVSALNRLDISLIFNRAKHHLNRIKRHEFLSQTLHGCVIINLFFENSTRTLTSFEIAAKRAGAQVINFSAGSASISKSFS